MKEPKNYKERRVYRFLCAGPCGRKNAVSFRRSLAKLALCKKCRTAKPDDRQQTIFGGPIEVDQKMAESVAHLVTESCVEKYVGP